MDFRLEEHTVPPADVSDNGVRAGDADSDEVFRSRVQDSVVVSTLVDMVVVVPADLAEPWFVSQFLVWWCDGGVHGDGLVGGVNIASGAWSLPGSWVVGEASWWSRLSEW